VSAYRLIEAEKASYPVSQCYAGCCEGLKERLLRLEGPSALTKRDRKMWLSPSRS
jgi:hypothetical protein